MPYTIEDLYIAYRKAKVEAYYEGNVSYGLKFALYEKHLLRNLRRLLHDISIDSPTWCSRIRRIGKASAVPKLPSTQATNLVESWQYFESDPATDWARQNPNSALEYRSVIDATVDFLVFSSLWVLKVGSILDSQLDSKNVYADRIDRRRGEVDTRSHHLFRLWTGQYQKWLRGSNNAIRRALERNSDVIVFNMDLRSYFHRIDATFLEEMIRGIPEANTDDHVRLTGQLVQAIQTWVFHSSGENIGVPVGLPASNVIANVLLKSLDDQLNSVTSLFYGRYVDDMVLVLETPRGVTNAESALRWLSDRVEALQFEAGADGDAGLTAVLDNHPPLLFSKEKISVLHLSGASGLDMLSAVEDAMQARASEQRLKAPLPENHVELGQRALILQDGLNREVSEIRQARGISLRRAAFAQIIKLMEQYERDLGSEPWADIRKSFYGLVLRHGITPEGLYIYFRRLSWIFSLMVSCGDRADAQAFLSKLRDLRQATGAEGSVKGRQFWENLSNQLQISAKGAVTEQADLVWIEHIINIVGELLSPWKEVDSSNLHRDIKALSEADWSRTPYAARWVRNETTPSGLRAPRGLLRSQVEEFRSFNNLRTFNWKAIAFPTRPMSPWDITTRLPMEILPSLSRFFLAFCGFSIPKHHVRHLPPASNEPGYLRVGPPDRRDRQNQDHAVVAVTSFLTTMDEWRASLVNPPVPNLQKYQNIKRLIAHALSAGHHVDYFVLPELSLPRRWMNGFATQLAEQGTSLIAGVEYEVDGPNVKNQCLVSLTTGGGLWKRYAFPIARLVDKSAPARHEETELRENGFVFPLQPESVTVFQHNDFFFSTLICSDLTNIRLRSLLPGRIDSLFVPEWNPDIDGFAAIIQSASTDLHAFVVQVNNRENGDSWIRAPYCHAYQRDIIRIKGGLTDYVVLGKISFQALREFQSAPASSCREQTQAGVQEPFKPLPIGFRMSPYRTP